MTEFSRRAKNLSPKRQALLQLLLLHKNQRSARPPMIPQRLPGALVPLSFAQQRLWFLEQLIPGNATYTVPTAVRLTGALDMAVLRQAFNAVVQRHDTLRTTVALADGQPAQQIASALELALPLLDLRTLPLADREASARRLATHDARQPFDLAHGPLVRATLVRLTDADHLLLLTMHHLISDGWSMGVLVRELAALYLAAMQKVPPALLDLPIQYADFALWQQHYLHGDRVAPQLAYWRRQLGGSLPVLALPTDRPRSVERTFQGASQRLVIPPSLTEAFAAICQPESATLFMLLLAAFQTLLFRYTGEKDIAVGSPIAGRTYVELEGLIGCFINTLVLRADLSGAPSFRELLRRVREVTLGAYAHQELPFEQIVEALQPERSMSYSPLFQVMFVLLNAPMPALRLPGLTITPLEIDNGMVQFDLTLALAESESGLVGSLEYRTDLFDEATITRMAQHFRTLLAGIVADPDRRISELPLLSAAERRQILVEWNDTWTGDKRQQSGVRSQESAISLLASDSACVQHLFEAQVIRTPDAVALVFEDTAITYADLNRRANQVAHHLEGLGVGPEVRVGICMERSADMLIGLLGVLKAGGAYVPLDPTYPPERLTFMLEDSGVAALLTTDERRATSDGDPSITLSPRHVTVVDLVADWPLIGQARATNPASRVTAQSLAYVIYTSGSTGRPKGVAIAHRSTVALLTWAQTVFVPAQLAGVLAATSLCFDLSVFELLVPLSMGGTVILTDTVLQLPRLPAAQRVTLVNTVPSAMAELLRVEGLPDSVRTVNLAGEPLPGQLVQRLYQRDTIQQVYNLYGPSEDTTYSTFAPISKESDSSPVIGRPIRNTQIYLLDASGQLVPVGVVGELYIGGAGLARGYLNRPDLTAERFVPNPFAQVSGARYQVSGVEPSDTRYPTPDTRLYKTGDLARYLPDGTIEFLGRTDEQVKLRGYRIELGEIQAVLARHPAVHESVVLAREDVPGEKRLVAYVVPDVRTDDRGQGTEEREQPASSLIVHRSSLAGQLRAFLKARLPEYMVPSAFKILAVMPLTPNGKVDRCALPPPDPARAKLDSTFVAPRTPVEQLLAEIWVQVLDLVLVGIHDNFIELGGDSILGIQIIARAHQAGLRLTPRQLFQYQTIAELAPVVGVSSPIQAHGGMAARSVPRIPIRHSRAGQDVPTALDFPLLKIEQRRLEQLLAESPQVEDIYPLSPMQQGMLFHCLYAPTSGEYVEVVRCALHDDLDVPAFQQAWQALIERHPALRTCFVWRNLDAPLQVVQRQASSLLEQYDWRELAQSQQEDQLAAYIQAARQGRGLELTTKPPMRFALFRLAQESYHFVWSYHHLLLDGWSLPLALGQVFTFYKALGKGETVQLKPSRPYRDYIAWLSAQDLSGAEAFWRQELRGIVRPTSLAADQSHRKSPIQAHDYGEQQFQLPTEISLELQSFARRHHLTLNTLLQGAWALLLSHYSGEDDVIFGNVVSGRPTDLQGVEAIIGNFVNTLPVRVRVLGQELLLPWLKTLQSQQITARQYEYSPLTKIQKWSSIPHELSLFESVLVFDHYPGGDAASLGEQGEGRWICEVCSAQRTGYPLHIRVVPGAALSVRFTYLDSHFDDTTIGRMLGHFQTLIQSLAANPDRCIDDLSMLTKQERQQLLVAWNDTGAAYPQYQCLQQLFEAQAAQTPDAVALILPSPNVGAASAIRSGHGDAHLTYCALDAYANQLAALLRELGVAPQVLVGVCMERSLEMVVGIMGVLKAGGAFLPLDPAYPPSRLEYMLRDSAASVLLTNAVALPIVQALIPLYLDLLRGVICLDHTLRPLTLPSSETTFTSSPHIETVLHNHAMDLVYMIYTSGSTGQPKGVPICHGNVIPFFLWYQRYFGLRSDDRIVQYHSLSFDFSTWEIFEALLAGACLQILPSALAQDVGALADELNRARITVLNMTPSQFSALLDDVQQTQPMALNTLRLLVLGGELLPLALAQRAVRFVPPTCQVYNEYGPTETTISSAILPVTRDALVRAAGRPGMPIGRPIGNTQLYVLSRRMQPLPIGVAGELYIGGAGLARGYHQRPHLTAERFLPNPFTEVSGARYQMSGVEPSDTRYPTPDTRLYKTGDLARYLPDGTIEFLGRTDEQVKLRGYRIELGEIAAVLQEDAAVREAVVIMRQDTPGDQRLVAYVVPTNDERRTTNGAEHDPSIVYRLSSFVQELRDFLLQRLPSYMIPAAFVALDMLPLTPNGKLDRKALPPPDPARPELATPLVAPRTPIEELVAGIWGDVLGVAHLGLHDNFFVLGGHSLLATQVIARLRNTFAMELPLRLLFEAPTVAALAAHVAAEQRAAVAPLPPIRPLAREGDLPLSFAQRRLWFLDQLAPGNPAYIIPILVGLTGPLNVAAFQASLHAIVQRHEALRTTFASVDGQPVQVIAPVLPPRLWVVDLQALPAEARDDYGQRLATAGTQQPFDLARGPLLRATLMRLSRAEHLVLLTLHHIVSDGWSMGVLLRELAALYPAFAASQSSPLPALPLQYADYAQWQQQWLQDVVLEQQLAYWMRQLANAPPVLELPTDHARPTMQTFHGASQMRRLPIELHDQLLALSQRVGVTLFMTLLAAFQVLLARYSGQDDIVVGSPIAGRTQRETEDLIGFFVNTLVLRTDLSGARSFLELLQRVREVCLQAYTYQDLPFERLVEELQPVRNTSHTPLFQVMFVLQNAPIQMLEVPGLTLRPLSIEAQAAKFDMAVVLSETAAGLVGTWEYATALFEAATIERMAAHFQVLLEGIVAEPDRHLSALPLLSEREQRQLLLEWNATHTAYPQDQCLHQLFEAQVEYTPDATALIFETAQLTYHELNARVDQLAHYLSALGVGPDVPVGICIDRSLDLVIGLLGILEAGAAYVPLDPTYPPERLAFMLQDAQVPVLVTQKAYAAQLPIQDQLVIILDVQWERIARTPTDTPTASVMPDNLAYIIYTSGSTGRPKGAMNTHRAICNRLLWMQEAYQLTTDDCVLQKTPMSFDVSVWEFFWPLLAGARLVLAQPGGHKDPAYLLTLIAQQQITTLHFVPSMLQIFLEEPGLERCTSLRRVICSGESLSIELQARFFARLGVDLHNLYGPTEAAVDVTAWTCERGSRHTTVPIGRPIANTRIYLLDRHLHPVPVGVSGELHIGGVALARGYLGRPDLTAERFVPNPFARMSGIGSQVSEDSAPNTRHPIPDTRLYRTGDLARYRPDGSIEFLGRIDLQVKIRGFRIELGEIEHVLAQHPAVRESIVVARDNTPGHKRLVAYVVPDQQHAPVIWQLLRLDREGLLAGRMLYELPNGMTIVHKNKAETDFMYHEICEEESYLLHGVVLHDGDCIFDVGANIGLFTLFASTKYKDTTIYAFEPIPDIFDVLHMNTLIYGTDVKLFNYGLSNETKQDFITYYPHISIISGCFADLNQDKEIVKLFLHNLQRPYIGEQLLIEELLQERLTSEHIICRFRTISEVIRESDIKQIDLLKIDVEKSEQNVLAGIEEQDWPKIRQIVVEIHDIDGRLARIEALLKGHGYDLEIKQAVELANTGLFTIYAVRPVGNHQNSSTPIDESQPIWNSPKLLLDELRGFLQMHLPDYMVPAAFVLLDVLPLTPNGKLDRRALPMADMAQLDLSGTYAAPRNPIEEVLASIWADVLHLERVGIHDNLFALGGHSLLATQIVARARDTFRIDLLLRSLFEAPTVARFAAYVDALRREGSGLGLPPLKAVAHDVALPLSFAQQRLWFLDQLEPNSPVYSMPIAVRLNGTLNRSALGRCLNMIVARHETLRTTFALRHGQAVQVIAPTRRISLRLIDLQALSSADREAETLRRATAEALQPFDLLHGPLLRTALLRLDEADHVLLLTMHHIISDGWSMGILVRELTTLYTAFAAGHPSPLPDLPIQYADYAIWQRQWLQGVPLETQLLYWKQRLANLTTLQLPTDHPRPASSTYRGARQAFLLSKSLTEALVALSRRERATPFMILLAAFQVLLMRYSGQDDVVVGTDVAGRTQVETEFLIGFFVNQLVLLADLSGNPPFQELLRQVRQLTLDAYTYQDVPFEQLVTELHPDRHLDRTPLFQVKIIFDNTPVPAIEIQDLFLSPLENPASMARFDLVLRLTERMDELIGSLEYAIDLFEAATIARMASHFKTLLQGIVAAPTQRIANLPLLTASERQQLVVDWNATATGSPHGRCMFHLFEEQVVRGPDSTALVWIEDHLTYAALNARANRLAAYLRKLGIGPEGRVGLCLERSLDLIVGILGVLKAGGAYVPLDPSYPLQRLAFMLADSQVAVVITATTDDHALQSFLLRSSSLVQPQLVDLVADWPIIARQPAIAPASDITPDNLAYVIYTSGSTGQPKGVGVSHRNISRLFAETHAWFRFDTRDVWTLFHSYAFDFSAWEIWGALAYGGRLVVVPFLVMRAPDAFYTLVCAARVTVLNQTPSAFQQFIRAAEESTDRATALRLVIFGGEALNPRSLRAWTARYSDEAPKLVNMYGITETSVHVTYRRITEAQMRTGSDSPIGSPIPDMQIYVLDRFMQPLPIGVPGELYISGAGLARGYLNRPDLTAERFIPNPFARVSGVGRWVSEDTAPNTQHPTPDTRLYRTGDRARYLPDGTIAFLGRVDNQVKIRGYRIELEEIEAVLLQHFEIRQAVVLAREDEPGDTRLVAYVVTSDRSQVTSEDGDLLVVRYSPLVAELRDFLKEKLPQYMVPTVFLQLEELPSTPTGKVDRSALPALEATRSQWDTPVIAPRTPIEEVLAAIWGNVLRCQRVGVLDNFFALGGHSLLTVQVISAVRDAFQVELSVRDVFEAPTVEELAVRIIAAQRQTVGWHVPPLQPVSREAVLPLSYAQQRLWFLDQLEPHNSAYNLPAALRLVGSLDLPALERSLNILVAHHETLRTMFMLADGFPVQVIVPTYTVLVPVLDLQELSTDARSIEVRRLAQEEALRGFDLAHGPLLRASLIRLGDQDHVLLLTMHHIVSDAWSVGVLIREIAVLYRADVAGAPMTLPALPIQYADYAAWQRAWLQGEVLEAHLAYWREQLAELPTLQLPTDHPRPPLQSFQGASYVFTLPSALSEHVIALSRREGTTLFMTLLAVFQALLARYSAQDDIVVGTPIANRTRTEIESLIGFFVNTLVLRTDLSAHPTFRTVLQRVREMCLEAYIHQEVPFEQVVDAVQPERDLSRQPLFQVMFALQNAPLEPLELPNLILSPLPVENLTSKFDLTLSLAEETNSLSGVFEYNTDLFETTTIMRMAGHFQVLLEGIADDPDQRLEHLSLLTEAERQQLLVAWNTTQTAYPQNECAHELFEAQVVRRPDSVAVVYGDQRLTYSDLNVRANQLAHYLQGLGIRPGARVGMHSERSLEMVVGLLGILKAGGIYIPLDPAYPKGRVAFMAQDSQASVLLTQQHLRANLVPFTARVICLDSDWEVIARQSPENPLNGPDSRDLIYIIYTSGTTGQPKGAAVYHRGFTNLLHWFVSEFGIGEGDRSLLITSLSFDLTQKNLFAVLAVGGQLHLLAQNIYDPSLITDTIENNRSTLLNCTPSQFYPLLDFDNEEDLYKLITLRYVWLGGEPINISKLSKCGTSPYFRAAIVNTYGPTECTDISAFYRLNPSKSSAISIVPIGRPNANVKLYILGKSMELLPVGVVGEVCVAGEGVGAGYIQDPLLTASKFVPNPFSNRAGDRLYRTGDVARYLPDGTITFLERADRQVKIRGYRIELEEVEAVVREYLPVHAVVVMAREEGASEKRLVAYVVPVEALMPSVSELRRTLQEHLPEYMIPAVFISLDALPLTPNGKVDRRALPAPGSDRPPLDHAFVLPSTPIEKRLAQIWADALQLERVGVYDNFFALGGDSILSIQIVTRAKQAGLQILPRQIFQYQTIAELAAIADTQSANSFTPADQTLVEGPVPLTPIQQWFFAQDLPEPHHFNQALLLEVRRPLRGDLLDRMLHHLVMHHDALRLRFVHTPLGWHQTNAGLETVSPWLQLDLSALPWPEQRVVTEQIAAAAQANLDLGAGSLLNAVLFDLGPDQPSQLLLVIHHLAVDGVSWRILLEDLQTAYDQLQRGTAVTLPPKTTSFKQWAERLLVYARSDAVQAERSYWLADIRRQIPRLPVDNPAGHNTSASARTVTVKLGVEETQLLLHEVPKAYHTQINDVLLTALAQAWAQWTGRYTLLVDLEGHGREDFFDDIDLSRTVGWFTSIFPVLLDLGGVVGPHQALPAIKEQLHTVPRQGIGYGILRYLGDDEARAQLRALPSAEISFNYLGQFDQSLSATGLFASAHESSGPTQSPCGARSHLLEVNGSIAGGQLHLDWTYSDQLHRHATIEWVARQYMDALRTLIAHCQSPNAGGYTPSDFPDMGFDQKELNTLIDRLYESVENAE